MELLSLRQQGSWWVRAHPAVTTPAVPGDPAAPSRGRGAPLPQPRSRDETCSSQRRLAGRETAPKPTAPAALRPGGASCHPGQLRKLGAVGKRGRSPGSALPTGCQAVTPPRLLATPQPQALCRASLPMGESLQRQHVQGSRGTVWAGLRRAAGEVCHSYHEIVLRSKGSSPTQLP